MMFWINCPTPETFPTSVGHPSRSQGPIAAPRCINSFTNSDTSVLDLLTCLSLSATSFVLTHPLFSQVNLCSWRLVPPSLSLFLTAPAVPVRQSPHLVLTHQHVHVKVSAVLPRHHVVAATPRIAYDFHRIVQRRKHYQSGLSTPY